MIADLLTRRALPMLPAGTLGFIVLRACIDEEKVCCCLQAGDAAMLESLVLVIVVSCASHQPLPRNYHGTCVVSFFFIVAGSVRTMPGQPRGEKSLQRLFREEAVATTNV